ncbi:MAG TPA: FHA domain-containing protein [Planctomycetota bacterium]|nr:FHA domain-containing protein [Planctomycetota bacterium]
MFKLHVYSQSGDLDRHFVIEGDSATIGRSTECNVVIDRKDISRHHARLLRGFVVDDRATRNGTHVDGVKIDCATSIDARSFEIGDPSGDNLVTIEIVGADRDEPPRAQRDHDVTQASGGASARAAAQPATVSLRPLDVAGVIALRSELEKVTEQYRVKCLRLEEELTDLRRKFVENEKPVFARDELGETRAEIQRLQQRVDKLTREAERRGT